MHNTLVHTPNMQWFEFGNYANIEINTFRMSKFGSFMNVIDCQQISDVNLHIQTAIGKAISIIVCGF